MSIQPSEFAKLAVVIGMALVIAERAEGRWRSRVGCIEVVGCWLIAGVPAALILLQPDLGTMLVLSATVFGVLAVSGRPAALAGPAGRRRRDAAVAAVAGGVLKAYQVDRFLAFTNPDLDPRGAGYNVEQARIAVGNGGLFGQGLFHGSQTRSGFVPEQHTDFVFTVAGEELGLVGAGLLIALLCLVIWRALSIAATADDVFGRVAAAGIACWFGFQAFQNIGMCLGIMPVTGVPLPFVSYGGSSMFAGHARRRPAPEHPPAHHRSVPTRYVMPARTLPPLTRRVGADGPRDHAESAQMGREIGPSRRSGPLARGRRGRAEAHLATAMRACAERV